MSSAETPGGAFPPLADDDPPAVGGYRLAARLGAGGMGRVYLSHTPAGRPVALKVIRPELSDDPRFRDRFRHEVRAARRVQALSTAPVIDSDTEGPTPWLATAYVPGPSLTDAVARHGALPLPTVLLLAAGTAEALDSIHAAGIVHRDLKPSNVLLAADGPRVIDFGIARAADATSLTGTGLMIGTPAFMAPEQATGGEVTTATDVFALGQVVYYALTGTTAFGEGTSHGVLYRIVHHEPDLAAVPEPVRGLVAACLAKDPAARPTPAAVIAACREADEGRELRRPYAWLPPEVTAEPQAAVPAPTAATRPETPPAPTRPATPPPVQGRPPEEPPAPTRPAPVPPAGPAAEPPREPAPAPARPAAPAPTRPPHLVARRTPPPPPVTRGSAAAPPARGPRPVLVLLGCVLGVTGLLWGTTRVLGDRTDGGPRYDDDRPATGRPAGGSPSAAAGPAVTPGVVLRQNRHVDLQDPALTPVASDSTNKDRIDLRNIGGLLRTREGNGMAELAPSLRSRTIDRDTLRESCDGTPADDLTTSLPLSALERGANLCLRTTDGTVAVVQVKGVSGSAGSEDVHLDFTVWRSGTS